MIHVIHASSKDLDEVSVLFNAYRMFYEQPSDVKGAKSYIKERIENGDSAIFVAVNEGKYIGFTQLYPTFSSISMKKMWILNDLFVAPEARNQGIGEILLQKAKEYALETNAKSISLCTAPDNLAAQRLYEKHGYEKDTQFLHYELML